MLSDSSHICSMWIGTKMTDPVLQQKWLKSMKFFPGYIWSDGWRLDWQGWENKTEHFSSPTSLRKKKNCSSENFKICCPLSLLKNTFQIHPPYFMFRCTCLTQNCSSGGCQGSSDWERVERVDLQQNTSLTAQHCFFFPAEITILGRREKLKMKSHTDKPEYL